MPSRQRANAGLDQIPVTSSIIIREGASSRDPQVLIIALGGFSTEIEDHESRIILKHKDDVVLDPAVIDQALREAGDYSLT